jgi:hypothetical protein
MELLDRYLRAVQFWLPKGQRQDIIAELSDDLHSEIEGKESELGRSLTNAEVQELLERRGDAFTVASRYATPRYLIGPRVAPIYFLMVRSFLLYFVLPWAAFSLCALAIAPPMLGGRIDLVRVLSPMWIVAVNFVIGVTIVFALVEWALAKKEPGIRSRSAMPRDPERIPRSSSMAELVFTFFVILWWRGMLALPAVSGEIALSPALQRLYFPISLLFLATALLAIANLAWPRWTKPRAAFRLAIDAYALLLGVWLVAIASHGGTFVSVSGSQAAAAEKWITVGWVSFILPAMLHYLLRAAQDLRRALGKTPMQSRAVRALLGE